MVIRTNKNLKLGNPHGSFSGMDIMKIDYKSLKIIGLERTNKNIIKFSVSYQGNETTVNLRAQNSQGEQDLNLVENKKDELIGKDLDEVINIEL